VTSTIKVFVSEDAYNGDAKFTVTADGHQVGGTYTVTTSHASGQWQEFDITGDMGANGPATVAINFLNDAWGGTASTDRNMYVNHIEVNGKSYAGATAQNGASNGSVDANSAPMLTTGSAIFTTTGAAPGTTPSPGPSPTPAPTPNPTPAPTPTPSTGDAAQETPAVARSYVAPGSTGTANGSAGADDIYATGAGQTLIGNGGNDVFHVGGWTDIKVLETGSGISEVSTWTANYTLADGIDNLSAASNANHVLAGNSAANVIRGNTANDVIDGHGGNDVLWGLGGADTFVMKAGYGQVTVADLTTADHVVIDGTTLGSFAQVQAAAVQSGNDVVVKLGGSDTLTLKGHTIGDLTAGEFTFSNVASGPTPTPTPAPTPNPTPAPTPTPTPGSGGPVIANPDAQPPSATAHGYVAPGSTGVANGTSGDDAMYATGSGQTLIGNGGNDVFHIGSNTDAHIVVGTSGVTTVETWASNYTLADGVNDLVALGNYSHALTGNGLNNWIVGSDGNDTIKGGAGNDVIQVGTGANQLSGGAGKDVFMFSRAADHDNVIHDFTLGTDMLDLRGALQGYGGSNPAADGHLSLVAANGGTTIMIDADGTGGQAAHALVTIENIAPTQLKAGVDYLWH
jgi:Ca2+-binding RTX toxin-like protein